MGPLNRKIKPVSVVSLDPGIAYGEREPELLKMTIFCSPSDDVLHLVNGSEYVFQATISGIDPVAIDYRVNGSNIFIDIAYKRIVNRRENWMVTLSVKDSLWKRIMRKLTKGSKHYTPLSFGFQYMGDKNLLELMRNRFDQMASGFDKFA